MIAGTGVKKVWTAEELQALPENGYIHEVVDGELILRRKNTFQHKGICASLLTAIYDFNRSNRFGCGKRLECWTLDVQSQLPGARYFVHSESAVREPGFQADVQKILPWSPRPRG